jgi:hypothetical protein
MPMQMMNVATFEYGEYAVSDDDAKALMQIAKRARMIVRHSWRQPLFVAAEQERTFMNGVSLRLVSPVPLPDTEKADTEAAEAEAAQSE